MNTPPKLTRYPAAVALTSAEKIAFRLGSLLLSTFTIAALSPLVYLVASVLDLSTPAFPEVALVSATWLALAAAVVVGLVSEIRPSPRAYFAVTASCAFTVLLWIGWIVFGLTRLS
jgi:hypothetical protein